MGCGSVRMQGCGGAGVRRAGWQRMLGCRVRGCRGLGDPGRQGHRLQGHRVMGNTSAGRQMCRGGDVGDESRDRIQGCRGTEM